MNLNDRVKVVLTSKGAEVWNEYYASTPAKYKPNCRKEGDALTDQLWGLMQIFGSSVSLGCISPFKDCEMEIVK